MEGTVSASHIAILTAAIVKISYLASSHVFHYLVRWPKVMGAMDLRDVMLNINNIFKKNKFNRSRFSLLLQLQISGSGTVLEFYQSLFTFYPGPTLSLEQP